MERKVCFLLDVSNQRRRQTPVQGPIPSPLLPTTSSWAGAFIGRGRGLHAETARSALTVILKWSPVVCDDCQYHVDCYKYN